MNDRLMNLRTKPAAELVRRTAWLPEWAEINRLWWKRPERVRILMYMDGQSFNGGSFYGLQHAINALAADPWPWVSFAVTTANRNTDASADQQNVRFTDLSLDTYDEVWLFGISSNLNLLDANEVAALESFMDAGGGVLTTGDHASLGRGLSGPLKRVGALRMYPAPQAAPPVWNTTIRDANGDGAFAFNEQSDATPQVIRPRYYYHWAYGHGVFHALRRAPHPLLCAEQGVLRKLPDHQHEGQVVIPDVLPAGEWPSVNGYQQKPEVVAWGRIVDPAADKAGDEFPVIGAYDGHRANVGRIVADSTWHHWFDINMIGFDPNSSDYRDITSYFQNVAAWLAPKHKQAGMRNGVFWLALHDNSVFEHEFTKLPKLLVSRIARDALGRWAPQCFVNRWILDLFPVKLADALLTFDVSGPEVRQPIEDLVLAEVFTGLREHFDIGSGRLDPPKELEVIEKFIAAAPAKAVGEAAAACERELQSVRGLLAIAD